MNKQIVVAGIDVGKFNLDISISSTQEHRRMQNHEDAFATLVEWLRETDVERVVREPTWRYHRAVSRCLRDAGFAVMEINPLRARRFAEALGRFSKNDRVDAAMLARLGQVMEFEARTPRSHAQTELGNLARGRSRLINSRTGLLSLALAEFQEQPAVVAALEAAIRELDKQTAAPGSGDPPAHRRTCRACPARRDPSIDPGRGTGHRRAAMRGNAGARLPRPPPGRGAAGRRPAGRRQRNPVRNPAYPGRAGRSPDCPVYGGNQRRHLKSGHAGILSAPEGGGKRAQGRDRCGHPKIDCARQRAAQSGSLLAASGADRSREFQHVNNLLINCNDRRTRSESGLTADTDAPGPARVPPSTPAPGAQTSAWGDRPKSIPDRGHAPKDCTPEAPHPPEAKAPLPSPKPPQAGPIASATSAPAVPTSAPIPRNRPAGSSAPKTPQPHSPGEPTCPLRANP